MSNILSQSATRIKTGVALVIGLLIIGLIDSFTLTWLLFGGLMLVALKEAMNLFKIILKFKFLIFFFKSGIK